MNLFELFIKIGVDNQASGQIDDIGKEFDDFTQKVGAVPAKISKVEQRLGDLEDQLEDGAEATADGTEETEEFGEALGDLGDDANKAKEKLGKYNQEAEKSSSTAKSATASLASFASKLGSGLATAAKIGAAAVGAAATAVAALTKSAVENYAEYEQLVGGAELMFGDAYETVAENAKNAYSTVQMSQNDYLEQVNGFATGLKTALDGNEQAAADLAHKIIVAEADIVAATGNSQEAVQNAFNGIMKSNYTMLDNLQLGITPTKEGFQEIIDKVNEWNATQGNATNYTIDNLADAQLALVGYIEMQGLAGYASKEASTTIQGSAASAKAAWSNLLTGMSDETADLDTLITNFVDSVGTVAENVVPKISTALGGISTVIAELVPVVVAEIPDLLEENLPVLVSAAVSIVETLISGIANNQEMLFDVVFDTVMYLADSFIGLLPEIVELGLDLLVSLANGIADSLPSLIPTIVDVVLQIADTLTDPSTLVALVDAAVEIIIALANGLTEATPQLVEAVPVIVGNLVQALIASIPQLVTAAITMTQTGLYNGLTSTESKDAMVRGAIQLVASIATGFLGCYKQIFNIGKEIFTNVKEGFTEFIEDPIQWGKDMIDNFIGGIKERWQKLKDTVFDVANSIKDFLGFSEPKKGPLSNFHTYAPDMMELFAQGVRDNESVVTDQIAKSFDFGEQTIGFGTDYSGAVGSSVATGTNFGGVTININGANYTDEQSLAEAITEALQNMTDRKAAIYA